MLRSIQGDLEYLSNELRMPDFNGNSPCWFDSVSRIPGGPNPMTDVSLQVSWMCTIISAAEGVLVPPSSHPIFGIVGASCWHCPGDLMHSGDLGVVQYLTGSILEELCDEWPGPLTQQGRTEHVWRAIKSKYDENQTSNRLGILKKEMFSRRDDFPCLKAKAAESRALLFTLKDICSDINDRSDRDEHRIRCLRGLCTVYSIFKQADLFLSAEDSKSALENYDVFLLHYHWLLKRSLSQGFRRYGLYFKFHNMWHIVEASRWLNPCSTWCYDFEDFQRQVVAAGRACVAGSPMVIIGNKVLQNLLLVLELQARSF